MKRVLKSLVLVMAAVVLLASCKKESSEKKILSFKFAAPAVEATIDESAKTIVAVVPFGTNVTGLVPMITISEKASVVPASGTVVDFTNPVNFTVTAEDGSTVVYKATVTVDPNGGGGGDPTDPTTWSGSISANTTWPDLGLPVDYVVDGWIYIDGNALLTIEPGVTIMFSHEGDGFDVGPDAGLRMVGTADKPIRLINAVGNPNPGAWAGIAVYSERNDNRFEYVEFVNSGNGENVIYVGGKLSMKNCTIDGALHNGVGLGTEAQFTAFENNTIKNCGGYPLWLGYPEKVNNLGSGNVYANNGNNMIVLDYPWLYFDATFSNQGIPYFIADGLSVEDNKKMTVDAGVEFVFEYDQDFAVGGDARIEVNGTASQPVVFRGKSNEDPWGGMHIYSNRSGNVINYARVMNCGMDSDWYRRACLFIGSEAKLTLTNNVFGPSAYTGVAIESISNWGNVTHSGNTFMECGMENVFICWEGEWNGEYYGEQTSLDELP